MTLFLMFVMINNTYAQRDKDDEKKSLKEHLWFGANIGNIGLSTQYLSSTFSFMGGYKFNSRLKVGAILHGSYYYQWARYDESYSNFDYGFGGLVNFRVYRTWFAHAEVDKWYIKRNFYDTRNPYVFTYIGGGYQYPSNSNWAMAIYLLVNVNPDSNYYFGPLDYRIAYVYNF